MQNECNQMDGHGIKVCRPVNNNVIPECKTGPITDKQGTLEFVEVCTTVMFNLHTVWKKNFTFI